MKFIVKHGKSEKDIRNLRQEIEILRQLRHENIIQMLDAFETKTDFCVVTGRSPARLQWLCTACDPSSSTRESAQSEPQANTAQGLTPFMLHQRCDSAVPCTHSPGMCRAYIMLCLAEPS